MSVHIEWLLARETEVEMFALGDDWVGAEDQDAPLALTLGGDDVVAIEGTARELATLAHHILAAVGRHL